MRSTAIPRLTVPQTERPSSNMALVVDGAAHPHWAKASGFELYGKFQACVGHSHQNRNHGLFSFKLSGW
jgi:hypothetical protein